MQIWTETSMATEDFLVNDCGYGQTIEAVGEGFPQFDIVTAFDFVVEAVDTVDRCTFVIATQEKEVLGVFDFVAEEHDNGF